MTHRNRWFTYYKWWFSMAMLVITRGYWLYQLWFFAYSRGSSQLASDAHLILAKLQCHPVTCQKLRFINISHTLFAHTVCLKLLKLENLLVCLLSLRAPHTHVCKFAAWKGHTFPTFSTMDYLGSLKLKPPCFNAWLPTFPPLANTLGLWSKSFYSSILKKNQVALLLCPQFMPRTITS